MKLPRFNLRDLFWLVLVCAVLMVWGLDSWRMAKLIEKLTPPTIANRAPSAPNVDLDAYSFTWDENGNAVISPEFYLQPPETLSSPAEEARQP